MNKIKKKEHKQESKKDFYRNQTDVGMEMQCRNLSLAPNVNQQEGNTMDWLIDHAFLHQWLCIGQQPAQQHAGCH